MVCLVILHGCSIDDNSLISIGAVILNNAKIGKNCLIGSKSLATENENADNSLVMGSPGKIIRQVTDEEVNAIKVMLLDIKIIGKNIQKIYLKVMPTYTVTNSNFNLTSKQQKN